MSFACRGITALAQCIEVSGDVCGAAIDSAGVSVVATVLTLVDQHSPPPSPPRLATQSGTTSADDQSSPGLAALLPLTQCLMAMVRCSPAHAMSVLAPDAGVVSHTLLRLSRSIDTPQLAQPSLWLLSRLAFDVDAAGVIGRVARGVPALLQALYSTDSGAVDSALRCLVSVLEACPDVAEEACDAGAAHALAHMLQRVTAGGSSSPGGGAVTLSQPLASTWRSVTGAATALAQSCELARVRLREEDVLSVLAAVLPTTAGGVMPHRFLLCSCCARPIGCSCTALVWECTVSVCRQDCCVVWALQKTKWFDVNGTSGQWKRPCAAFVT